MNNKDIQKHIDEGSTPLFGYPTVLYEIEDKNKTAVHAKTLTAHVIPNKN